MTSAIKNEGIELLDDAITNLVSNDKVIKFYIVQNINDK